MAASFSMEEGTKYEVVYENGQKISKALSTTSGLGGSMELDHRIQGNDLVDENKHLNYAYSPNENGKSLIFHKKDSVPVCNILLVTRQESHNVPV